MLKKEFMCECVWEWVSVLIVICTWHSRTPNADHPLSASVALSPLWCGAHPSGRKKIIMCIRLYVLYTCMYVLSFSTAECLQYTLLMSDYTHTYTRAYIHTSLTTHMYVCMYVRCECLLIVQCMHMYHIYIYHFIYLYVCVWGISHRKKCICMNALK